MHPIDADELKKLRDKYIRGEIKFDDEYDLIDKCPTIDAEPVVYAEWIDKPTGRYGRMQSWCSACGEHNRIGGIESNRHRPRCPHCGAHMQNGG